MHLTHEVALRQCPTRVLETALRLEVRRHMALVFLVLDYLIPVLASALAPAKGPTSRAQPQRAKAKDALDYASQYVLFHSLKGLRNIRHRWYLLSNRSSSARANLAGILLATASLRWGFLKFGGVAATSHALASASSLAYH